MAIRNPNFFSIHSALRPSPNLARSTPHGPYFSTRPSSRRILPKESQRYIHVQIIDIASSEFYYAPVGRIPERDLSSVLQTGRFSHVSSTTPYIASVFVYSFAAFVACKLRR
eukprot:372257-Amorphochlora_amoeboformis.AAC.1